jgi:hypothetical protein
MVNGQTKRTWTGGDRSGGLGKMAKEPASASLICMICVSLFPSFCLIHELLARPSA